MDSPIDTSPALSQKPQKKKSVWILILIIFACLCVCLSIPLIAIIIDPSWLNLLDTGAARENVQAGNYEGTIYTAPQGNFSCDFNIIMQDGFSPVLNASENIEVGTGTAFATDDFGQQYGVDYFKTAVFTDADFKKAISNPDTRQQSLQAILENVLLPALGEKSVINHQEFLQDDTLFVVITSPEASLLIQESNGTTERLDYQQGYYIFATGEWFYFVYSYITPTNIFQPLSPVDMQSRVDKFYQGCQFQP